MPDLIALLQVVSYMQAWIAFIAGVAIGLYPGLCIALFVALWRDKGKL